VVQLLGGFQRAFKKYEDLGMRQKTAEQWAEQMGLDKGLIVIAAMSNLIFKVGLVAVSGSRRLLLWVALLLAVPCFTGALVLWLWPTPAAG
jgi:hypothetical protein